MGQGSRRRTPSTIEDLELEEGRESTLAGIDSNRDRSAYLVACHWDSFRSSRPYSVYKMEASAASRKKKRLKRLGSLTTDAVGKSFTSVCSRHRAWIVGVGGICHGRTVIFDTNSRKVIQGPDLNTRKRHPLLTTMGAKVYAMSKIPSWVTYPNFPLDFPPWFEVLDLSNATVVTDGAGRLHLHEDCSWTPLPHPPCFSWEISPTAYYISRPSILLVSHVVVGPYIVVSFNHKSWGTHAFDTAQEPCRQWHKVDEDCLPFVGGATPLAGSSIFLASSQADGPINAYSIRIVNEDNALKLSITVLPVKYMDRQVDVGPCSFSSLGNGSFCLWSLSVDSHSSLSTSSDECFPQKMHVNLRTYQIDNPSLLENWEQTVNPEVAVSNHQERILYIASRKHGYIPFESSLVSMDVSS